jgi:hypothetical protein
MQKALSGCIKSVTTDAGVKVETLYYLDANERRSWHRSAAIDRAARLPFSMVRMPATARYQVARFGDACSARQRCQSVSVSYCRQM